MRLIVVRIHFAEPVSSRDENATDGAFRFRRRRPVCEAAVRRRRRWLQGFDIQGVAQLEECRRRKPEAAGSCPATLTNNDGDCGVVVCIARCERAGPGSKPGDRPIVSPPTDGNLGIPRCLRNSGFCVRIAGWGPNFAGIAQERSIALQASQAGSVTRVLHQTLQA